MNRASAWLMSFMSTMSGTEVLNDSVQGAQPVAAHSHQGGRAKDDGLRVCRGI